MKSVLLTRSWEANLETTQEIGKYFHYINCPVIKYKTLDFDINILKNYSNIIITSKYAATIITEYELNHNIWVVGNKSKQLLKNKGLKIAYAGKNVDDLMQHFLADLYEQAIYLSSNEITKDLPDKIKRYIIYNVEYLNDLPLSVVKELKNSVDFILLYSQNSAKTLLKLLSENNLLEYLQNSLVIAISSKVANIVRPFFKNVVYCDDQNPNDLIKLLFDNAKIQ
ncbi:uroporphyrinogen-III synthase [Rickettsia endosymbiont of Gonocerus acuteangulatus]|uniref:uroporphyrinogen-III synthase n=1 Tax=Rickettsia endosymbiont of Gonocerus acuteangulatus TaxID=3066266 RepID=UPI003132A325